jgi:hypothetical protein
MRAVADLRILKDQKDLSKG